jgi:hypothetical protein
MRRVMRSVGRGAASAVLAALTAFSLMAPPTAGVVMAAPAAQSASFRDLPASVRAGGILTVQVGVATGTSCDGTITYRDGDVQKLDQVKESDGRCRWTPMIPTNARRGNADITVNVHQDADLATIQASIDITRQDDDIEASFHALPGIVRRGDDVAIRIDVDDGAACQGSVIYDDGRVQALPTQTSTRERCRWPLTIPADGAYGVVRMVVGVTLGASSTTLAGSFEVGRKAEDAQFAVGLMGLPASVRREDSFAVRALVPDGATCTGTVSYFGVAPLALAEAAATDGACTWTTQVPTDARPGTAEIDVTAKLDNNTQTVVAQIGVDRGSSNVDTNFKDLTDSIQRGQTLEIRVSVPDNATCSGSVTFLDSAPTGLATQTERKERCLWELPISSTAPRGTATVRVTVTDGTDSTTLLSNVEVLGKGEITRASWASDLPGSVKPGEAFDVKVSVPDNASCSGAVTFADGTPSALQSRDESGSQCKWRVSVPASATTGTATVQVSVLKDKRETKLSGTVKISADG